MLAAFPPVLWAQVIHHVSFPELRSQAALVRSEFPAQGQAGDEVALRLPTWTPGSYVQQNFDANVEISAITVADQSVSWKKVEKDTWQIAAGGQPFAVTYRLYADKRNVSTSWISEDYALLNGASVFFYTDATRTQAQQVMVQPAPGQGSVHTALPRSDAGAFLARDFDELVDNPIVVAPGLAQSFRADGHDYRFLNVGHSDLWNQEQVVEDLQRLVRAANDLFDDVPLQQAYWFINILNEGNGGLEHDHSTVMHASRWQMTDRPEYLRWLSVAAHEYLHAWNVRRMRPRALASYDYRREQYTPSLWVAEGITSYYDDLLLSRSRVAEPSEYLDRLAAHIHTLEHMPGRFTQSLEAASMDSWTRYYRPVPNSLNRTVSYYIKGAVVGFVLDTQIRRNSRGRQSLDDIMRVMWERYKDQPYAPGAFRDAVEEIAGVQARDWLEPLVTGTREPDVDQALSYYGLQLDRRPLARRAEQRGQSPPSGLGINWQKEPDGLVVDDVLHGGAAHAAGVLPGDELLGIDNERMTRHSFETRLRRLPPGTEVELLLVRQNRIIRRAAILSEARSTYYELTLEEGFGDRKLRRMEAWLGQSLNRN